MLQLPAPAKLNLFLHIVGRRPDGYHELQTLFQLLDYGDELIFSRRTDSTIAVTTVNGELDPQTNLVVLAANQLQQQSRCSMGADIKLTKNLPMGGGLGGGSSDAATTLIGLNKLWNLEYSKKDLAQIGVTLGADVPVFIHGHTAWAEGIGEVLSAVTMPQQWYLVLVPTCHVSTSAIFNNEQLTRNSLPITIRAFREHGAGNSCQVVVEKLYPEVKLARLWLDKYAPAQMTGTGACVFTSFATQAQAEEVFGKRPSGWQGFIARGVNTSPVYGQE